MKDDITKYIAEDISSSYCDVLLNAYDEQQHRFPITLLVVDFMVKLRERNLIIDFNLDNIFADTVIMKIYDEANDYVGKK